MSDTQTTVLPGASIDLPGTSGTYLPPQTYFSIREVSQLTQVRAYVIRYWETQFGALRPARRESGQRKFTQRDIDVILMIKELLYVKRFTIEGAKQFLKRQTRRGNTQLSLELNDGHSASKLLDSLRAVRKDLEDALKVLKS
jgi:DNA-binding transcriptional MerR regulator